MSKEELTIFTNEAEATEGLSRGQYQLPVKISEYKFLPSEAHVGQFATAIDIAVPHPDEEPTVVYAPASGVVEYVEMGNSHWGPSIDYQSLLNYINIRTVGSEFVEIAHVKPLLLPSGNLFRLKPGDYVSAGQPIALVGLNGWVSETNGRPDSHVHMFVGEWNFLPGRFKGLKIRWQK